MKKLTKNDIQFILDNVGVLTDKEMAKTLNCSLSTIAYNRRVRGKPSTYLTWNNELKERIRKMYYDGVPYDVMVRRTKISESKLRDAVRRFGFTKKK